MVIIMKKLWLCLPLILFSILCVGCDEDVQPNGISSAASSVPVWTVPTANPDRQPTITTDPLPITEPVSTEGADTGPVTTPAPPVTTSELPLKTTASEAQTTTSEPITSPTPEPSDEDFVRIIDYIPDALIDLRYATDNNFTGKPIYTFKDAWLRYGTVKKLAKAADELREQGYRLVIWDAFRPTAAQWKLWEICPDPTYVSNPNKGFSSHSRGNTVDISIVSADGYEVIMPTGFDDFTPAADRDYSDVSDEAGRNARMLENILSDCGFKPYFGEWWHFSDRTVYEVEEDFLSP